MKIDAKTRDEYFSMAGERESELRELDALIKKHAPYLMPTFTGGMGGMMPGYGMQPYKTKSSSELSEWPVLMLAAQKNYISLYACAVIDGKYIAELYSDRLGKVSCGKSCIRFKKLDYVNTDGLISMLKDINKRFASGEKLYGN